MKIAALAPLALLSLIALPAAATPDSDFAQGLQDVQRAVSIRSPQIAAVERTLTAMNDGVGAGEAVVAYIREKGIRIAVAQQPEAVKAAAGVITLSESLPAYPRVYGPLIASEVARMMLADMPACAERSYMRRATAGRVWLELGGTPSSLPVVEPLTGDRVAAIVEEIGSWASWDGAQMTLYKTAQAENLAELPELRGAASTDAERAALDAANARFVAFLLDERYVRQAAGLR